MTSLADVTCCCCRWWSKRRSGVSGKSRYPRDGTLSEDSPGTLAYGGSQSAPVASARLFDSLDRSSNDVGHSKRASGSLQTSLSDVRKSSAPPQYIEEKLTNTTVVKLHVGDEPSLGIVITGGADKAMPVCVSRLVPGGLAEKSDVLEPDDLILSINGTSTSGLRQEQVAGMLTAQPGSVVEIEIEYEMPETAQNLTPTIAKCTKLALTRDGTEPFGLILRGGVCPERRTCRPLMVTHLRQGSSADRDGRLKAGDRLLEINGTDVTKTSLPDAMDMLTQCGKTVVFLVEYNVSVIEAVQNASSPLLVEIDRPFCCSLGIEFISVSSNEGHAIVIGSVTPASIADRCGALHVGDRVLSINDVALDAVSVAEATRQLQYDVGERLVLEILPRSCNRNLMMSPVSSSQLTGSTLSITTSASSVERYASAGALSNHSGVESMITQVGSAVVTGGKHRRPVASRRTTQQESVANVVNLLRCNDSHVCHVDVTDVTLVNDTEIGNFGFAIDSAEYSSETFTKPPVIIYLEPGGIAEKSGLLQEGDRVLSLNGWSLRGRSVSEVNDTIAMQRGRLTIRIEFDVADAVVGSSGTYLLKMAKRGAGVGVSISCPKNRLPGHPLVISDVRKGSVAHRTGTISPGDYLLAVDDVWLDDYTLEDAAKVLTSVDRIVKLRIQKNECYADEPDPKSIITFNVELPRFAGPLGISLTSKSDAPSSVIIVSLAPDGLAEKTGALRIGDQILAINGVRLQGKNIEDAIRLLPTCDDGINIKIMRYLSPGSRIESPACGCNSASRIINLDSVLELWDGWSHDYNVMWAINHKGAARDLKLNGRPKSSSGSAEVFCDLDQGRGIAGVRHKPPSPIRDPQSKRFPKYHRSRADNTPSECSSQAKTYDSVNPPSTVDVTLRSGSVDVVVSGDRSVVVSDDLYCVVPSSCKTTDLSASSSVFEGSVSPTVELVETSLFRSNESESFGFSLSNGINKPGVFVGAVKEFGPAFEKLRPYDRILQVNGTPITDDMPCADVVTMVAQTGTQLDLVVVRRQEVVCSSSQTDDVISCDYRRRFSNEVPSISSGFSEHHLPPCGEALSATDEKTSTLTTLKELKEDSV